MRTELPRETCRYTPLPSTGGVAKYLVSDPGAGAKEQRYPFFDRIEIGRDEDGRDAAPGLLLIRGATVSWRHCIIRHDTGGCCIRDVSRNGTRVDGRRLVPNVETAIRIGQALTVGDEHEFLRSEERRVGKECRL